jgi:hypothetical protein
MNATLQTFFALLIVGASAVWLLWRSLRKKDGHACGGSCGCAKPKTKLPAIPGHLAKKP